MFNSPTSGINFHGKSQRLKNKDVLLVVGSAGGRPPSSHFITVLEVTNYPQIHTGQAENE